MVFPFCLVCGSTKNCHTSVLGPVRDVAKLLTRTLRNQPTKQTNKLSLTSECGGIKPKKQCIIIIGPRLSSSEVESKSRYPGSQPGPHLKSSSYRHVLVCTYFMIVFIDSLYDFSFESEEEKSNQFVLVHITSNFVSVTCSGPTDQRSNTIKDSNHIRPNEPNYDLIRWQAR